jgi:hypothetical protein
MKTKLFVPMVAAAPASGRIEYHETSPPPGAAFYRTAQP